MSMYYFYCPNCNHEEVVEKLPRGTIANPRDGFGMMIHHFECSKCHNLDAGYMKQRDVDDAERSYYRSVIKMYQGIRGMKGEVIEQKSHR